MNNFTQVAKIYLLNSVMNLFYKSIRYDNNRVFLIFTGYLLAFNVESNLSLTQLLNITHNGNDQFRMDMKIYNDLLIYATNKDMYYYNLTTKTQIKTFPANNTNCLVRSPPYLIFLAGITLIQYDEDLNQNIFTYTYSSSYYFSC
jgi:hypothetical protein